MTWSASASGCMPSSRCGSASRSDCSGSCATRSRPRDRDDDGRASIAARNERGAERARSGAMSIALTVAGLTLREAARRRVVWALLVLTVVLLALSAWGFSKLVGLDTDVGTMTSGEARLVASLLLNLIMFGFSLVAAIGTAFLAGPTVAGEVESGQALAILACAALARPAASRVVVGCWPPAPASGLALLAAETITLLTLALLLSSVVST